MILTRGKIIIMAIFIAIAAGLAGLVAFSNMQAGTFEQQVVIELENVKMKSIDEQANVMTVQVDFAISNNADQTLTISTIDYELYADDQSLGLGFLTLADVPMVGRPALFPHTSTTIPSDFRLTYADEYSDIWNLLQSGGESDGVTWTAVGSGQIESALSLFTVSFESSI